MLVKQFSSADLTSLWWVPNTYAAEFESSFKIPVCEIYFEISVREMYFERSAPNRILK